MTTTRMTERQLVAQLTQQWVAEGEAAPLDDPSTFPCIQMAWAIMNPDGRLTIRQACQCMERSIRKHEFMMQMVRESHLQGESELEDTNFLLCVLAADKKTFAAMRDALLALAPPKPSLWRRALQSR